MNKAKIAANNYDQAAKELEAIQLGLSKKISNEVNEDDNGHFTVVFVRSTNNEAAKRYDHQLNVQQLNPRAFKKAEEKLATSGFDKLIIIHTADENHVRVNSKKAVKLDVVHTAQNQTAPAESPAEIELRVIKQMEQKYAGYVPASAPVAAAPDAAPVQSATQQSAGPGPDAGATNNGNGAPANNENGGNDDNQFPAFYDITVNELKEMAKTNDVDITGLTAKESLYNAMKEWHAYKNK